MVSSDISKVKTSNTKTVKPNYSKPTSMSTSKARNTNSDTKSSWSFSRKPRLMNNRLPMKLTDSSLTLSKCIPIRSSSKLKLLLSINTWQILTIKITAFKKSSKALLKLMIKSEKVLIEKPKLSKSEARLMMLLEEVNLKFKAEFRMLEIFQTENLLKEFRQHKCNRMFKE